jgi:hypothetical protein
MDCTLHSLSTVCSVGLLCCMISIMYNLSCLAFFFCCGVQWCVGLLSWLIKMPYTLSCLVFIKAKIKVLG